MKIGWMVYYYYYGDDNELLSSSIEFYKEKPKYCGGRLVQIVYTEVDE